MISMTYDPDHHHRRSVRLPGHDYSSPGAYFVTICTRRRVLYFDVPVLRAHAEDCWRAIAAHSPRVTLDEWVVMRNHVHGILVINEADDDQGRGFQLNAPTTVSEHETLPNVDLNARNPDNLFSQISPRRNTLGVIVRTYKAAVTTAARRTDPGTAFAWQRGFYEHIVRNEREHDAVRRYIRDNPLKWSLDRDNPNNLKRLAPPGDITGYLEDLREYLG
jgi:putative transposase